MTAIDRPRKTDDARSARARRTALVFGLVALAVFVGFIALTALSR